MKTSKYLAIALATVLAAAPFGNEARANNDFLAGLLAGCLGMGIISSAANSPRTVVYSDPSPVVYSTPTVYSSPTVYAQPAPVVYTQPSVYSAPVVYSRPVAPVVVRRQSVAVRQPAPVVVNRPAVVNRSVVAPQPQIVSKTTVVAKPAPARPAVIAVPRSAPAPVRPNSGGPIFNGR